MGWLRNSGAIEPLIAILKDKEEIVRKNAIGSLGQVSKHLRDKRALEPIISIFNNSAEAVAIRKAAAFALEQIEDSLSIEDLATVLNNKAEPNEIRMAAMYALQYFIYDPRVRTVFKKIHNDPNENKEIRQNTASLEEILKEIERTYQ